MKAYWVIKRCRTHIINLFLVACAAFSATSNSQPQTLVETDQGKIEGEILDNLRVFKGIPFAAPPVGDLRWRAPEPPKSWSGVRETKSFAPACYQTPNELMNVPTQPVSEDCLYLNVWTPAQAATDSLPVLVWIHGGGFSFGSTAMPMFDGAALAKKGVVMVSVTYRLGPFGFLAHPELSEESSQHVSGNYGLLDQIASLKWVQNNIRAFGGNPNQVTIMGESAGGMSVSSLVQSPLAKGLFVGAIAQSGALMTDIGVMRTLKDAEHSGEQFAQSMGAKSIAELRAMAPEKIWQMSGTGASFTRSESWPIWDDVVLPANPIERYQHQQINTTPVLIGNNDREGDLFSPIKSLDAYKNTLRKTYGVKADDILKAYPANDDASAAYSASSLMRDTMFGTQTWTWARLQAEFINAPVYYFHFAHNPPTYKGGIPGPVHGAELPYVFHTPNSRPYQWREEDYALSELMMSYWTNFVKYGNPNGDTLPKWPVFTPNAENVMYFQNGAAHIDGVPHEAQMRILDPLKKHP